jgi:hypothetical protein
MAITDLPKTVQYVTDGKGRRVGVLLDIRVWDSLVEWVEHATDSQIAVKVLTELHGGGRAGCSGYRGTRSERTGGEEGEGTLRSQLETAGPPSTEDRHSLLGNSGSGSHS